MNFNLTGYGFNSDVLEFLNDDFIRSSGVYETFAAQYCVKDGNPVYRLETVGINSDDIKVSISGNIISVTGETEDEYDDKPFSIDYKILLDEDSISNIESIEYTTKNGMTCLVIKTKEKEKNNSIEIKKV